MHHKKQAAASGKESSCLQKGSELQFRFNLAVGDGEDDRIGVDGFIFQVHHFEKHEELAVAHLGLLKGCILSDGEGVDFHRGKIVIPGERGGVMDRGELIAGLKLNQIAEMVGYSDPKYMSKVFKEEVGMLPAQFRKQNH